MEAKGIIKMLRRIYDMILALLALASFIVLVSDVTGALVLWQACLFKGVAFAILFGVSSLTPWFRGGLREYYI